MSSETHQVSRVVNAFAATWNRHDMDAFAELFAEDAESVNVVGIWWKGRAEIKGAHEFTHRTMFATSRLSIQESAVRFPTPGIAISRSRLATAYWSIRCSRLAAPGESSTRRIRTSLKVSCPGRNRPPSRNRFDDSLARDEVDA